MGRLLSGTLSVPSVTRLAATTRAPRLAITRRLPRSSPLPAIRHCDELVCGAGLLMTPSATEITSIERAQRGSHVSEWRRSTAAKDDRVQHSPVELKYLLPGTGNTSL